MAESDSSEVVLPDLEDSDEELLQYLNSESCCEQNDVGHRAEIPKAPHGCKLRCLETLKENCAAKTCLDNLLSSLRKMSRTEADLQIFGLMKGLEHDRVRLNAKRWQYKLWGHPLCVSCFKSALNIGTSRFQKLKQSVQSNLTTPRLDLRCMNGSQASISLHVDGYLFELYWSIGLPYAKESVNDDLSDIKAEDEKESNISPMLLATKAGMEGDALNTRWLPNMKLTEVYEGYEQWCFPAAASRTTFYKVWKGWRSKLRILPPSGPAKCSLCEKLKTYMRTLSDPVKRQECKQYHQLHVHDNLSAPKSIKKLSHAKFSVFFSIRCNVSL